MPDLVPEIGPDSNFFSVDFHWINFRVFWEIVLLYVQGLQTTRLILLRKLVTYTGETSGVYNYSFT